MTVIYNGPLHGLGGYKGMSIDLGSYASVAAQTFTQPFLDAPAIFLTPTSDDLVYAASSAVGGFTPTASSATGSGAGTAANWLAFGRGDKQQSVGYLGLKQDIGSYNIQYGAATIDSATTFDEAFSSIPTIICGATSDEAVHVASAATTGFTPTESTGAGGTDADCDYIAFGPASGKHKLQGDLGVAKGKPGTAWIEVGTASTAAATAFQFPFQATPQVVVNPTSDGGFYAASADADGFTATDITLAGGGAGTSCVYFAIGTKLM